MKTYKHKTLGWIAEIEDFNKPLCKYKTLDSDWIVIHRCFISSDSNREEVVEKDWVEMCVDEIFEYQRGRPGDEPDYVSIRKIIEKHAPKQKKFTREEIQDFTKDYVFESQIMDYIVGFLDKHNLLSFEVRKSTDSQYQKEIKITDKNIDGCDHIFDDTVYQSRPPQKICIKCGKFFTY